MKSKLPKRYYFIPVIYVVLILGFINLHLQDIGGRFITKSIGPVTVRYRQEAGVRQQLSRITVSLDGLSADLSTGVQVEDATGRSDRIPIKTVETTQDGFQLELVRGGRIDLVVHDENGGFAVLYRPDTNDGNNFTPVITFTAPSDMEIRTVHRALPLIELRRGERDLLLVHNNSITSVAEGIELKFNQNAGGVMLSQPVVSSGLAGVVAAGGGREAALSKAGSAGNGSASNTGTTAGSDAGTGQSGGGPVRVGMIASSLPADTDALNYWFFGNEEAVSSTLVQNEVQQLVENMQRQWRQTLGQADGRVVGAVAAESMKRQGSINFGELQSAAGEAAANASWYASTFVNNIVDAEQNYTERENQLVREISRALDQNPEQILTEAVKSTDYPNLLQMVVFSGNEELETKLDRVLGEIDSSSLQNSAAVAGLFILAVDALEVFPERFSSLASSAAPVYERVLANISLVNSRLVYRSFQGAAVQAGSELVVDPLIQMKLARALQSFGRLSAEGAAGLSQAEGSDVPELAARLGSALLHSVLQFTDESSSLPAEITASVESFETSESRISASRFYPFLTENNFYPRVVSLRKELDQNMRLWTSAQAVGAVQRADGFEITLDFAAGETHYVVIRGVEPFEYMEMYGQRWNGDWRFQNYNVGGWFYNRDTQTLFMKIRHRNKIERLRFYW